MFKKFSSFFIAGLFLFELIFISVGCDLTFEKENIKGNGSTSLLDLTKIKAEREKAEKEKAEAEAQALAQAEAEAQAQAEAEKEEAQASDTGEDGLGAGESNQEGDINQTGEAESQQGNESLQGNESQQGQESLQDQESQAGQESQPDPQDPQETEEEFPPMPQMPEPKKLTLMVYMAADNDLESHAIQNLKAMEHADFDKMNVLVLLDRAQGYDETNGDWTDTRLFELVHDQSDGNYIISKRLRCPILSLSATSPTELDMGNFNVLRNFITFAKNEYEAEKYALIIWGHGTGWRYSDNQSRAVAIDDNSNNFICVSELGRALKNQGICVVGFDTCFAGIIENLYELKNACAYTVASPGVTPAEGWNYKELLEELSLSDFMTQTIAGQMAKSSRVSTSVFDNSRLQSLMESLEKFSESLSKSIVDSDSREEVFYSLLTLKSYSYSQYPCDLFLDLYSLADFYSAAGQTLLAENARILKNSIIRAAYTEKSDKVEVGIHFIPKDKGGMIAPGHSEDYKKNFNKTDQCLFIKESQWWVPTSEAASGSLLDKLFYRNY